MANLHVQSIKARSITILSEDGKRETIHMQAMGNHGAAVWLTSSSGSYLSLLACEDGRMEISLKGRGKSTPDISLQLPCNKEGEAGILFTVPGNPTDKLHSLPISKLAELMAAKENP